MEVALRGGQLKAFLPSSDGREPSPTAAKLRDDALMIHFLRHVSFCLWVALVIGGFGSLWILPLSSRRWDGCGAPAGRRFAAALFAALA